MEYVLIASAIIGLVSGLWFLLDKLRTVEWRRPTFLTFEEEIQSARPEADLAGSDPLHAGGGWPVGTEPRFPEELAETIRQQMPDLRLPTAVDIRGEWAMFGNVETLFPFFCDGDFTAGAGREYAVFLFGWRTDTYKVVAFIRNRDSSLISCELAEGFGSPTGLFLRTVQPGKYRPLPEGPGAERRGTLRLKRDGINFGQFEVSDSIFYWDKRKKTFKRVWMSD